VDILSSLSEQTKIPKNDKILQEFAKVAILLMEVLKDIKTKENTVEDSQPQ